MVSTNYNEMRAAQWQLVVTHLTIYSLLLQKQRQQQLPYRSYSTLASWKERGPSFGGLRLGSPNMTVHKEAVRPMDGERSSMPPEVLLAHWTIQLGLPALSTSPLQRPIHMHNFIYCPFDLEIEHCWLLELPFIPFLLGWIDKIKFPLRMQLSCTTMYSSIGSHLPEGEDASGRCQTPHNLKTMPLWQLLPVLIAQLPQHVDWSAWGPNYATFVYAILKSVQHVCNQNCAFHSDSRPSTLPLVFSLARKEDTTKEAG
jgi:hypothetical protein